MKKILTLLLVLVLCMSVFVACKNNNDDPTPDPTPDVTYDVQAAAEVIKGMYKEDLGLTPKDFTVVPQVKVGTVTYPVTWTVDTDKVTVEVSEDGKTVTINVPEKSEEDFTYNLTATITAGDGTTASVKFELNVAKYDVAGLVENPQVDTPYTFGMVQGNLENKIFYLKGGMNGYYMDSTDDPTKAMNVYLETTEGGYYFYCLVGGTKTYINMVVSGTHVNGAYEATPTTVYTYDAESKTLKAVVNDEDYWFGTRNDKSYTTIGPCAVSYEGFYCQFYAANTTPAPECEHTYENGTCTKCGEKDPNYVPPITPNPNPSVQVEAGKGYIISAMNANGAIYFNGTVGSGRFNGSTDKAEATVVYVEAVEGGFLLYFFDGETKTYVVIEDNSTGGSFTTDATAASVLEWNTDKATLVVADDDNNRAFGVDCTKTFTNFSPYDIGGNYSFGAFTPVEGGETPDPTPDPDPECEHNYADGVCTKCGEADPNYVPPHEHEFVNGECACGEKDPNYVAPEAPAFGVIDAPVAGTAYKFGMVQGKLNDGKVYYLKGGMSSYYMSTTTNVDEAIDVYLEVTDGGYYLYTLSGETKTYINMKVSGTHVNGAYEATASTVYRFDETSKTVIAVVNGADYWFGTRNDNTYTTVGPCAVSYKGFYCQFYGELGETPDPTPDPEPECEHNYVDGVCTKCGEADPNYVPPHEHEFVNGECACGEKDPNYVPPHEHDFVNGECACGEKDPNYVPPEEPKVLTIPEALEIAKAQGDTYTTDKYYITGIVTNISNTFYGNFHLVDADGNDLYVYGLKKSDGLGNFSELDPQPAVGDTITIYTVLGCYYGDPQAKDAWLHELVQHTEHTWADATCKVAKTCTICGKTEGEPLEHTYVDGACTGCGKAEPAQGAVITSTETFAGLSQNSGYDTRTTTSGWVAVNAAVLVGGANDSNPVFKFIGSDNSTIAITLNGKTSAVGKLTSATLQNGISKLSFNYGHAFSDANGVDITINILQNGEVVATTRLDNDAVTQKTAYEFVWELDQVVEGEFVIEIVNNSPSNNSSKNKDRVSIFNISWDSAPVAEN